MYMIFIIYNFRLNSNDLCNSDVFINAIKVNSDTINSKNNEFILFLLLLFIIGFNYLNKFYF